MNEFCSKMVQVWGCCLDAVRGACQPGLPAEYETASTVVDQRVVANAYYCCLPPFVESAMNSSCWVLSGYPSNHGAAGAALSLLYCQEDRCKQPTSNSRGARVRFRGVSNAAKRRLEIRLGWDETNDFSRSHLFLMAFLRPQQLTTVNSILRHTHPYYCRLCFQCLSSYLGSCGFYCRNPDTYGIFAVALRSGDLACDDVIEPSQQNPCFESKQTRCQPVTPTWATYQFVRR